MNTSPTAAPETSSITFTGENAFAIWGFMGRPDLIDNLELKNTDSPVIPNEHGDVVMCPGDSLSKRDGKWVVTKCNKTLRKESRETVTQMGHPCIFATLLPVLREKSRELGYALGLHGSMTRDLDLIAVPWVEEAVPDYELARELQNVLGGYFAEGGSGSIHTWATLEPGKKPHGRVAYTLRFGGDKLLVVDLSVMPRIE